MVKGQYFYCTFFNKMGSLELNSLNRNSIFENNFFIFKSLNFYNILALPNKKQSQLQKKTKLVNFLMTLLKNKLFLINYNFGYYFFNINLTLLPKLSKVLKNNLVLLIKGLYDIIVVDYPSKLKRFELSYCFLNVSSNCRLFFKGSITENQTLISISSFFCGAN
jgi:hypothetical protein